jgi:putative transcriptional regulator
MTKKYRSEALGALPETVQGSHRLGPVNTTAMREFSALCVTTVEALSPRQIALRKRSGVSQAVFASYLNVATGLVSKWERGEKQPQGRL